jgi:hypothetical protein
LVYVDDRDGHGWKYAYSNRFKDNDERTPKDGDSLHGCDQTGRGYNDKDMGLEVRFQDQDEPLEFFAANYKKGLPDGYKSPLQPTT